MTLIPNIVVSLPPATDSQDGYLLATDCAAFNAKASAASVTAAAAAAATAQSEVDALETTVATLTTVVGTKASTASVTTVANAASQAQNEVDALEIIVSGKATTLALAATDATVASLQSSVSTVESTLSGVESTLSGKVNTSDYTYDQTAVNYALGELQIIAHAPEVQIGTDISGGSPEGYKLGIDTGVNKIYSNISESWVELVVGGSGLPTTPGDSAILAFNGEDVYWSSNIADNGDSITLGAALIAGAAQFTSITDNTNYLSVDSQNRTLNASDGTTVVISYGMADGPTIKYTPYGGGSDWSGSPTSIKEAIDRIAYEVAILKMGTIGSPA
jgi:hypothetical protein